MSAEGVTGQSGSNLAEKMSVADGIVSAFPADGQWVEAGVCADRQMGEVDSCADVSGEINVGGSGEGEKKKQAVCV